MQSKWWEYRFWKSNKLGAVISLIEAPTLTFFHYMTGFQNIWNDSFKKFSYHISNVSEANLLYNVRCSWVIEKIARNEPENFSNLNFLLHYHDQYKSYEYYILRGGFTHLYNYFLHETYSTHLIVCILWTEGFRLYQNPVTRVSCKRLWS